MTEIVFPIQKGWNENIHIEDQASRVFTSYHVWRDNSAKIFEFLRLNHEGAILVSGKRGVGKTSLVFSCINDIRNEQRFVIPVHLNASNFELLYKQNKQKKNDFSSGENKRILLQGLIRRLYQEIKGHSDSFSTRLTNFLNTDLDKIDSKELNHFLNTDLGKIDHTDLEKINRTDSGDLISYLKKMKSNLESLDDLYERAVAREVNEIKNKIIREKSDTKVEVISKKEYILDKKDVIYSISVLSSLGLILYPGLNLEIKILSMLGLISVQLLAFNYSRTSTKSKTDASMEEDKGETYYKYDYDIHTLEFEFEKTLKNLSFYFKIVFIIDELDKFMDHAIVFDVLQAMKPLINNSNALFILIADDKFYEALSNSIIASERSPNFTLFSQLVFIKRPRFHEFKKFVEGIVDLKQLPLSGSSSESAMIKLASLDQLDNQRISLRHVNGVELHKESFRELFISKTNDRFFIFNNGQIIRELLISDCALDSTNFRIPAADKDLEFELSIINKNELYLKNSFFVDVVLYLCFKSKSDFFNLYRIIKNDEKYDDIRKTYLFKKLVDDEVTTIANFQRVIEHVFHEEESIDPTQWYHNDRLLENIYEFFHQLISKRRIRFIVIAESKERYRVEYRENLTTDNSYCARSFAFGVDEKIIESFDKIVDILENSGYLNKTLEFTSERKTYQIGDFLLKLIIPSKPLVKAEKELISTINKLDLLFESLIHFMEHKI